MPAPLVLHVDIDAFFASVEEALNPALRGRPVIVGGDGEQRTVVASASYAARRRGVRTAMRTREAKALCPEAVFLRGDYRVYRRAADAVFARVRRLSPLVQATSLDEAYVQMPRGTTEERALGRAEALCREVRRELALDLSVGVGGSLLAARLATRIAKPGGCFLLRRGYERAFLHRLPVGELPGIGRRTRELLERFNVRTVRELALVPLELLVDTFGARGRLLHAFAKGDDPRRVDPCRLPRSVSRESSLEDPATTRGSVLALASWLLERAMKEVQRQDFRARTVGLRLGWVDGRHEAREIGLAVPTSHEANLVPVLEKLLDRLFTRRLGIHRVGVTLKGLHPRGDDQEELFPDPDAAREARLGLALERIRARHGFGAVLKGPAIDLLQLDLPRDRDGFRLRVPSLTR